jgi:hypothetical protein
MRVPTLATLSSYVSQHPVARPVNEIAVWTWIAGLILFVCVLAAALTPDRNKLASSSPPVVEQLLLPPIGHAAPPTSEVIADPNL